jgi:hypothetical protein
MFDCLTQYYRCPEEFLRFAQSGALSATAGYFQFGEDAICYGSYVGQNPSAVPPGAPLDALRDVEFKNGTIRLPFDPSQVINNLRCETYAGDWRHKLPVSALARMYYFIRPLLPVNVRKYLQEIHFRGWNKLKFPRWPVDCSVDNIHSQLLMLALEHSGVERIPFIWFWPQAASSCAIVTHDVETQLGSNFCKTLMDIDDSFGIKASFQVIPEKRYSVTPEFLASIRDRGFEVVIHDLNHDGHLYRDRKQFLERAAKINSYAAAYGAEGFRAATLYRKQLWYDALNFSYDMSVPNVAHLDPQRGGCCTVMPYFLGNILELPVTTTQDYTLFHILNDYSIELWKKQTEIIMGKHGLISFIVHPDYVVRPQQRSIYEALLAYLSCLEEGEDLWITTPGEVNRWWRQRAEMKLVRDVDTWRIEGPGAERACIAYATLEEGKLVYLIDGVPSGSEMSQRGSCANGETVRSEARHA